jgi:MinD superfamily P-loop ATPase
MSSKAVIDEERCVGCGICTMVCPMHAISMIDGKAVISNECIGCGECEICGCPSHAIGE